MTTKNSEILFDLQNFATSTVSAAATVLSGAYNSFDGTQMAVVGGSGSSISVNAYNTLASALGGWMVTDSLSEGVATIDTSGTSVSTLSAVYNHDATFTYYSFSGSNTSFTIANGTATDSTAAAASNTYVSLASASLPAGISFEDSIKPASTSSPITLTGGDVQNVSLSGIGSIASFTNEQQLALAASGGRMSLTGVNGTVALSALNNTLRQNINGATINAAVTSGDITINGGDGWAAPILSADNVSLGAIDTIQTWLVSGATYNNVNASSSNQITVTGSGANYMNVNVDNGNSVNLSATNNNDTIAINSVILNGAAKGQANVAANTDDSLLTAAYGAANGLTVGGAASIGGAISTIASGGNVTISTAGTAHITGVDKMASGAAWSLGANATVGQLGNDTVSFSAANGVITAATNGTQVAGISGSAAVGLVGNHTVAVGSTGAWTLGASNDSLTIEGSFDSLGNATVASGATLIGGANKSLAIGANGANDTMSLGGASQVTLNSEGVVTAVNSLAAGSTWLVRGGSNRTVSAGDMSVALANASSSDNVLGELTMSSLSSAPIAGIDELSGNATVLAASISGLDVAGTTWSISGTSDSLANFNSAGNLASVTANSTSDLTVAASTDAAVAVSMTGNTMGGTFNGVKVYVHDSDNIVGVQLESENGISGITSLLSGATVIGDNAYQVNDNFNIRKGNNSDTKFTLGGSSQITIQNVADGDAYTVTGSSGNTIVYDINSLAAGGSAKIGMNSAAITVSAASATDSDGAYVKGIYGDDISIVGGVKLNDTISSSGDKNFTVIYDTSAVTSSSTDTYVMAVNDARISLNADDFASIGTAVTMDVNNSGSVPYITISEGIAKSSTVTVGKGIYKVGASNAVTVNDPIGFLYIDDSGNVDAADSLVADIRREREEAIDKLTSTISSPSEGAFHDFYNIYYENNNSIFADHHATVASYENATTTTRAASLSGTGVNIMGEKDLSDFPNAVTLQSYLSTPINVEHIEGKLTGATLQNALIDVSNGNNSVVAIGMNESYDTFAVNHTILGSGRQSTLVIGSQATGDNVIRGGNGGNYLVNKGGKASLYGGSGSDTIYAMPDDYVAGGSGADYFLDVSNFEISDYKFNESDVIIATKLSSISNINRANVVVDGNRLAVAGGSTITIGSEYDDASATKAIVADASNHNNRALLIWAGVYDSEVNATEFPKGALIISDNNEGGADTVLGSSGHDTVFAGGNDLVNSGQGNDIINIATVASDSGRRGTTVVLSEGGNSVHGWTGGFDNESGSNVIGFESNASTAADLNFKTKNSEGKLVVAWAEGASLNFDASLASSNGGYDFLVGQDKVTFIASNQMVSVTGDSALANYYKGEKSAGIYVGESVTTALNVDLKSANFVNITKLDLHNESHASIVGSAANESITIVGTADAGASKTVAAGAGNDLIVSGGNSTVNAGNMLLFGIADNVTYSTGRDTVENFGFYRGRSQDMDLANADVLYLGDVYNYRGLNTTSNKLEISLGDSADKVIISDSFSSSDNRILRARFSNDETIYNCKFGLSAGNNNFTYDGETNAFFGNTSRGKDTLNVSSSDYLTSANIWLNDRNFDQKFYYGINVINASLAGDIKTTLVGSSADSNVIYASAGTGSTNSLWGGGGEANTLIGGAGEDHFFYYKAQGYVDSDGVGHSSNDLISGVQNNDVIHLADIQLSDISSANIDANSRITITFNNGSALNVTGMSTETTFRLADGQDYRAIINGNDRHWDPSIEPTPTTETTPSA